VFDFLDNIFSFFLDIYMADKRPDARKFTIGCLVMVLIFIGLLAFIFWNVDTGSYK
jgi:hypothetical protein